MKYKDPITGEYKEIYAKAIDNLLKTDEKNNEVKELDGVDKIEINGNIFDSGDER